MQKPLRLTVITLCLSSLVFLFQNFTPYEAGAGNATSFANNPQSINQVVFGPSIRSEDGRTIFNLANKRGFWSFLRDSNVNTLPAYALDWPWSSNLICET